jgi:glucose/arabinose dehydrogenase
MLRFAHVLALLLAFALPLAAWAQLDNPIPAPIAKGAIVIELETVVPSGMAAPIYLTPAPGDDSKLYVVDQAGAVRIIAGGALEPEPFLDVKSRLVDLGFFGTKDENDFDERGLLGLAFHPGYADPASPGYRRLYTYTSEPPGSGKADFTVPLPVGEDFDNQIVLAEWQVDAADPDQVDPTSRRELFRLDDPQFNHNAGMVDFGPDGYLYIAIGDGGAANDLAPGHSPGGNGQDTSNLFGDILRIDPLGTNSANGKYGIPGDNPFAGAAPGLDEIYAYGLRNPFRFSFDRPTGRLIVGDVGQNDLEEIDIAAPGGNYGWPLKEGTFKFLSDEGDVSPDLSGLPPGLIDPVAQYDHDEGLSVIGGFVYHGAAIPELAGKYVFGDFSKAFDSPSGRLFYADLDTGVINELQLGVLDRPLGLFLKGFGQGPDGEIYVLAGTNLGPFGSSGQVLKITAVPEPAAWLLILLGALMLPRSARQIGCCRS